MRTGKSLPSEGEGPDPEPPPPKRGGGWGRVTSPVSDSLPRREGAAGWAARASNDGVLTLTNSASRGIFIALEGGEGAGKSTQIAALARMLQREGREVVTCREPGGTPA